MPVVDLQRLGVAPGTAERTHEQFDAPTAPWFARLQRFQMRDRVRRTPRSQREVGVVLDRGRAQFVQPRRLRAGEIAVGELGIRRAAPQCEGRVEQSRGGGSGACAARSRSASNRNASTPSAVTFSRYPEMSALISSAPSAVRSRDSTVCRAAFGWSGSRSPQAASTSVVRRHRPPGPGQQRGEHGPLPAAGQRQGRAISVRLQRPEHPEHRCCVHRRPFSQR